MTTTEPSGLQDSPQTTTQSIIDVDGASQCTKVDEDPWQTGAFVACCSGAEKQLVKSADRHHYLCLSGSPPQADERTPATTVAETTTTASTMTTTEPSGPQDSPQ